MTIQLDERVKRCFGPLDVTVEHHGARRTLTIEGKYEWDSDERGPYPAILEYEVTSLEDIAPLLDKTVDAAVFDEAGRVLARVPR